MEAPLVAAGLLAAEQQLAPVLDGVDLAEDRLDDRLAAAVDGATVLGSQLARHPLLGRRVTRQGSARRRRLRLGVLEAAGGDVRVEPVLGSDLDIRFREVAG